ncbi:glycosyltransferase family 4 protein [Candidatus Woesearchaeota archaeon]|nr:glycosyltransferase family 4 protein [Candidatus Woesearchaeota archaeon]
MKIAHISMFYHPTFGGVEKVIEELALRQIKEGHEVHVFCCDSDKYKRIKPLNERINSVNVHRHRYWLRLSLFTFIWPTLIFNKHLWFGKFDIFHSHVSGHLYNLIAGIIAKIRGIKYIHTTHCPWTESFRPLAVRIPLFFTNLIFNRIAFKLMNKIIAITPWELPILEKWIKKEKIIVLPNGMDKIFFSKVKDNNFRKKFKIPEKEKLVLFFGRYNITKGPEKLILATKEILKERKDITFLFIGPDEGMLNQMLELAKGENKIMIQGPIRDRNEVVKMYQSADVYTLPSFREGLPLTIFESFASGLPVIASPVNGVPYEMENNVNGLFVNYGDIRGLKNAILKVLDNKNLSLKFSKNNIIKAKNYDWDIIYKKYMEIYNN